MSRRVAPGQGGTRAGTSVALPFGDAHLEKQLPASLLGFSSAPKMENCPPHSPNPSFPAGLVKDAIFKAA